jgi:hypothetical protein
MAPYQQQPAAVVPTAGFVIAMRAKLTTTRRQPWHEWIIVSRWGPEGQYFSIGRTRVLVVPDETAPIHLAPAQTAMAGLLRLPPASGAPTFLFVQRRPASVSVAGEFAPVEGYVRLHGLATALRLCAEGRCVTHPNRSAWRIEADRVAWIGEFIEGASSVEKN